MVSHEFYQRHNDDEIQKVNIKKKQTNDNDKNKAKPNSYT